MSAVPAMPNFRNAAYNPLALRELLRSRFEREERLVAWGVLEQPQSAANQLATVGFSMLPVVGVLGASIASDEERRVVVVLTDHRLLLLRRDKSGPRASGEGLVSETPIERVRVRRRPKDKTFELWEAGQQRRMRAKVLDRDARDGRRLEEALDALADGAEREP